MEWQLRQQSLSSPGQKNLPAPLLAFPLTLLSNQSSLLHDTRGTASPPPPLHSRPRSVADPIRAHSPLPLLAKPTSITDDNPPPPLFSTPPPSADSQLPVLSYLELQDRGQGERAREKERGREQRKKAEENSN